MFADHLKENFLNKICTVLTHATNLQCKDAVQFAQFFTGKVVDINEYGVWLQNLHNNTYGFFAFPIIGIVEEQNIPENDPRAEQIKEMLKKKTPQANSPRGNFIPIESLTKMVKDSKKSP